MISHVVNTTEDPVASIPVAQDAGVVLRLVSRQVFFAGEAASCGLRALRVPTEEVLAMPLVMFAKIAASSEDGS
jgi:hypothetical protein